MQRAVHTILHCYCDCYYSTDSSSKYKVVAARRWSALPDDLSAAAMPRWTFISGKLRPAVQAHEHMPRHPHTLPCLPFSSSHPLTPPYCLFASEALTEAPVTANPLLSSLSLQTQSAISDPYSHTRHVSAIPSLTPILSKFQNAPPNADRALDPPALPRPLL